MDSLHYSYYEYSKSPILDEKFHLGRRLMALLLCVVFLFPYFRYNYHLLGIFTPDDSFFSVSSDADFCYSKSKKGSYTSLFGSLKEGELQLIPDITPNKNYHFAITTRNALIVAENAVLSIISYEGGDGINYTHVVCKKGNSTLYLYDENEPKVSSLSKYLSADYEALIYLDESQNKIGFVRFEADGTNPRPEHGVYTRKAKTEGELYEYLEIDPLYYSVFLIHDKYTKPSWESVSDSAQILSPEVNPEEPETNDTHNAKEPSDFSPCTSPIYFCKYIPWGEEETVLIEEKTEEDFSDKPNYSKRDIEINDNLESLGGETPLYLNVLTLHENFPSHTVLINGPVIVNSLILISSAGKNESHLINKDSKNRVLPLSNYFKTSENGFLINP